MKKQPCWLPKQRKFFGDFSLKNNKQKEMRQGKKISPALPEFHINFLRHNFCYSVSSIVVEIIFHRMSEPFD